MNSISITSYKQSADTDIFQVDEDMNVEWHVIDWPTFVDVHRSSDAFATYMAEMHRNRFVHPNIAHALNEAATLQTQQPDFTADEWDFRDPINLGALREDTVSEYGGESALSQSMRSTQDYFHEASSIKDLRRW